MNENVYVDYAIKAMSDLFKDQMSGKTTTDLHSTEVITEKLMKEFSLEKDVAASIAEKAFEHWMNVYYPD